ncbi:uncharacterized protein EV422DRAFT_27872 [Fimicolochytrium jonesii]|uniref:uncharacterized protein n=1 Tax=Fimicolochytrium jonesii TaxID=1396493 RepID=UPI0022FDCF33|nr:uncharacterized protein EV422DRAFT_27872 [Fimicolochytrium jonesii]KAI8827146.1 hypothetical protein EV422DRAFT_27872 [Fimicolochytrium jonesii]
MKNIYLFSTMTNSPTIRSSLDITEASPAYDTKVPTLEIRQPFYHESSIELVERAAETFPAPAGTRTAIFSIADIAAGLKTKIHAALLAKHIIHLVLRVENVTYVVIQYQDQAQIAVTADLVRTLAGCGPDKYRLFTPEENDNLLDGRTLPRRLPFACAVIPTAPRSRSLRTESSGACDLDLIIPEEIDRHLNLNVRRRQAGTMARTAGKAIAQTSSIEKLLEAGLTFAGYHHPTAGAGAGKIGAALGNAADKLLAEVPSSSRAATPTIASTSAVPPPGLTADQFLKWREVEAGIAKEVTKQMEEVTKQMEEVTKQLQLAKGIEKA